MQCVTFATGTTINVEQSIIKAQQLYPSKAGKTELHHIVPKYFGGDSKGLVVPLDAAYHQVITNEFRRLYPYGQHPPSLEQLGKILESVYNKCPLPTH